MALTRWEDRALLESNPSAQTGFCRGYGGGYLILSPSPLSFILEENQSEKLGFFILPFQIPACLRSKLQIGRYNFSNP